MKPNSSLAKVQTFLHIQNLPNKKLVRQVLSNPLNKEDNDFKVFQEWVRDFDAMSYHRGNPRGFPLFLW